MYKEKFLLNNVNDGELISKYDILSLFYYKTDVLINRIKLKYFDIFDEDILRFVVEKKENELTDILNYNECYNYKDNNNASCIENYNVKIRDYIKNSILKTYLLKIEQYERIEHFYNIIILNKILLRKKKHFNKVRILYKKQSINCVKSIRSGIFIPFVYFKSTNKCKQLILFLCLSIPSIASGILLFITSGIALFLYIFNNILNRFKKFIRTKKMISKNRILRYLLSFVFYISLFSSKLIVFTSKFLYKISYVIYTVLSSFQFSILKKRKHSDKISNNMDKYVANDNKIRQIKKNKVQTDNIKNKEKIKSKFQKMTEIEFDKLIFSLIKNLKY